jgi:hypothetical protein
VRAHAAMGATYISPKPVSAKMATERTMTVPRPPTTQMNSAIHGPTLQFTASA